ncbi:MAG: sulfite exporter TauE/SafE family protein [Bacteroidota bacterium]
MEYQLDAFQWGLALSAAFILGLSKAGLKGISVLLVTIMVYAFGGKASTGVLLPMLIMGDIFAVWYYNRYAQWSYLFKLLPWMLVGVLIGVWTGKDVPEALFKQVIAVIILGSVVLMLWWERRKDRNIPTQWWFAGPMGLAAGFTTMIGNLAGPISNIYFLAIRLPKDQFIGTAAWLFFIVNLFKLPFHIFVWKTVSYETLVLNLKLMPGIAVGLLLGIQVVKLIKDQQYRYLILFLTALAAAMIFFR